MCATAGLRRNQAACRQISAPGQKSLWGHRLGKQHLAGPVDRMHLADPLRKIYTDSRYLSCFASVHGTSFPLQIDFDASI
jgi:hypothetical protein